MGEEDEDEEEEKETGRSGGRGGAGGAVQGPYLPPAAVPTGDSVISVSRAA